MLLDFYEDSAESWEEGYDDKSTLPVLKRFAQLLPQGASVPDIGCGVGVDCGLLRG